MFASLFLEDEKRYQQTVFTIVNYVYRKTEVWIMSKIGRNKNIEKLLQTKCALPKLPNWVQLKFYSERTTPQKRLVLVINGRYLTGLTSFKK